MRKIPRRKKISKIHLGLETPYAIRDGGLMTL
jgi:hypothetical protein